MTALAAAGASYAHVTAACCCLAMRDPAVDAAAARAELSTRLPAATAAVVHSDAAAVLAAATGGALEGVAIVAGACVAAPAAACGDAP